MLKLGYNRGDINKNSLRRDYYMEKFIKEFGRL